MTTETVAICTERLTRRYGALAAVDDVSLSVESGARVAVIGPNGAGKSTLLGLIAGTIKPNSGSITVGGSNVTTLPAHKRARLGLVKTFQHSSLFDEASCIENVRIAVRQRLRTGTSLRHRGRKLRQVERECGHYLEMVGLATHADAIAGALSHGQRRALDLAVTLALEPAMMLLDEPMAGMTPSGREHMITLIRSLPETITVLLVEHDVDVVYTVADDVIVMASGQIVDRGTPGYIQTSAIAQEAYLGQASAEGFFHE